jgi:hypothetical protein
MARHTLRYFIDCLDKNLCFLLNTIGAQIMDTIKKFAEQQNTYNEQLDKHITALKGDVDLLNNKIMELQNSPSTLSEDDKEVLETLSLYAKGVVDRISKLDELTPPEVPVE